MASPERPSAPVMWWRAIETLGPTLLVAAVIAARNPSALFRAEFWAEDATEFFFGALASGVSSLTQPVYGYHFFLSRVVAYVATFAPVFYAPYLYAWASLLINTVCVAYIAREGFSWIASKRWQRVSLALVLTIGPGTSDAFLNLANLPNVLALLGLLLLIERPFALNRTKTIALIVLALSSGQMVFWLPIAVYLAWVYRSRSHAVVAAAITVVAVLNIVGSRQASSEANLLAENALGDVARLLFENAFTRLIPGPLLGPERTGELMVASSLVFWSAALVGFAGSAALVLREYRRDARETTVLVLAYAAAIGGLGVVALSRNYAVPQLVRESGTLLWDIRYSVLPGSVAIIIWTWWLLRSGTRALNAKVASGLVLCAIAANVVTHWAMVFPRPDLHWHERSGLVQWVLDERNRTGLGAVITIHDLAVHPVGWLPSNGRNALILPAPGDG
jgi:hypothetical protein